mgnify:CR=1 FL=1
MQKFLQDEDKREQRETEVIRLVKWMTEHPKIRRRICEDEYEVTPEEFIEIAEMLEENGFHEMIYVLPVKNQMGDILAQATSRLLVEKACNEWERLGTSQLLKELKDTIREEMKLKEIRGTMF